MIHPSHFKEGFTLIEVLLVIAIMLLLLLLSVSGMQLFASRSAHLSAARVVLGTLEEAHARTLASHGDVAYGVHFEAQSVTLFQGATYDASAVTNEVRTLPVRASITSIALSGGVSNITFTRLQGRATASGTVTVATTADASVSRTISIYESGFSEISI
jgi:prepilin-type N-terminal cleavage/methylation domain-containing protein